MLGDATGAEAEMIRCGIVAAWLLLLLAMTAGMCWGSLRACWGTLLALRRR